MSVVSAADLLSIAPELILALTVVLTLLIDLFGGSFAKMGSFLTSLLGIIFALTIEALFYHQTRWGFSETIVMDSYSVAFESIYLVTGLVTLLVSYPYFKQNLVATGEYCSLVLCALIGMMFMTSGQDLLILFLGIELMSLSSYVLVASLWGKRTSYEAALKYLLMGAFSSGFFLYGVAFLYGATESINITEIIVFLNQPSSFSNPLITLGLGLLFIGTAFKIALAPFHMWAPDVYSGAPSPIAGFLSGASKAASFAIFIRVFLTGMPIDQFSLKPLVAAMAVITMLIGNFLALQQKQVKRMLAYSSVAHAGYAMLAVVSGTPEAIGSILFYAFVYALMSIGAFGVLAAWSKNYEIESFDDLTQISQRSPGLAFLMSLFLLSMMGLPLTAGFIAKYQILHVLIESKWNGLALVAIFNSAIALYYYLKVIVTMYMKEKAPSEPILVAAPVSVFIVVGLLISASLIVYLGIFPNNFIQFTHHSVASLPSIALR